MLVRQTIVATAIAFACISTASAEYYLIPIEQIVPEYESPQQQLFSRIVPHAVLDDNDSAQTWVGLVEQPSSKSKFQILLNTTKPIDLFTGTVYLPNEESTRLNKHAFECNSLQWKVDEKIFYQSQQRYYQWLADGDFTGKAWFESRVRHAVRKQGQSAKVVDRRLPAFANIDRTFSLFSGTNAITENTQLDRALNVRGEIEQSTIDVDSIAGITIREFDWKPYLKDIEPTIDSLAKQIPFDQHVVFVDSISDVLAIVNELDSLIMPTLNTVAISASDSMALPMYLQQMNLDLTALAKSECSQHIQSIAITGSDPYSELGTDIGIVIEFDSDEQAAAFARFVFPEQFADDEKPPAMIDDVSGSASSVSHGRRESAYLIRAGVIVMLSNSPTQIRKLNDCKREKILSIATLDGYRFFRHRYQKDAGETAFVFMSDAAIRRWCSARWRIGQSRRLRAAMRMRTLQADLLLESAQLGINEHKRTLSVDHPLTDQRSIDQLGEIKLIQNGVHSERYGSTAFVAPIAEMNFTKVTQSERAAYERWRDSYQRNWSNSFDPIGVQIKIDKDSIATDISVMPLILSSSYRFYADNKPFSPRSGDRHLNSIAHFIASTRDNENLDSFVKGMESVELYVDQSDVWRDFDSDEDIEAFFLENINKIPLVVAFTFDNNENADRALSMLQMFTLDYVEEVETQKHKGVEFVRNHVSDAFTPEMKDGFDLFRYRHEGRVVFSLNEKSIRQSIERAVRDKEKIAEDDKSLREWYGQQIAFQANSELFRALELFGNEHIQTELKKQTWKNLPILNEWKRLFPNQDPLDVHQRFWNQRLLCAGKGELVWDENLGTMKSTKFGCPADPGFPMGIPMPWRSFQSLDAGVTLEEDGLRAKLEVKRK